MDANKAEMSEPSLLWQAGVYVALLLLLVLTVEMNHLELGRLALTVAIAIAVSKALLVVMYFMHVRYASRVTWVFVIAGVLWLMIMLSLTLDDYLTRDWMTRSGSITARETPVPAPPGMKPHIDPDELKLHQEFGRR